MAETTIDKDKIMVVIYTAENHDEDKTPYEEETGITRLHF